MTTIRITVRPAIAVAALLAATAGARAQPAGGARAGGPFRTQVAAGIESYLGATDDFGYAGPRARVVLISRYRDWTESTELRAMAWWIQRSSRTHGYGFTHRIVALAIASGVRFDFASGRASFIPTFGLGFAPWVHGSTTYNSVNASTGESHVVSQSASETGKIWIAGVALRFRRFAIEQYAVGLLGAEGAVTSQREYFPLMIGVRF